MPNLLTNPGLEIWQRGAGPFNANTSQWTWTADKWRIFVTGTSALAVSRVAADAGQGSQYAMGFTYTHGAAGNQGRISQRVDGWQQLAGRSVALSVFVKCSVVGAVRILVNDGFVDTTSGYNTGTTGEVLSVVATLPANTAIVDVRVICDVASATGYVDSATLVVGTAPVAYTPLHQAEDWLRCQRVCAVIGGMHTNEESLVLQCVSTTQAIGVWRYPVEMPATPTAFLLSAASDWALSPATATPWQACTALISTSQTARDCRITATVAGGLVAGNATLLEALNANARMTLECNL